MFCCRQRFDVYVCTAADRDYALEAWRLLDSNNDVITDNLRSDRIVCSGTQKKELSQVLRVQAPIAFESGGANQHQRHIAICRPIFT